MPELTLRHGDDQITVVGRGTEIARYVFRPATPRSDAPKPYLEPIRSLSGAPMSAGRPWGHRWHNGLQMTWAEVSGENFWGGPSYRDGEYRLLDNVGSIRHLGFDDVRALDGEVTIEERLDWLGATGARRLAELRTQRFAFPAGIDDAWLLDFNTRLINVNAEGELRLGSPGTRGRAAAGYAGLFWRGPRSWTGGRLAAAGGRTGGAVMGALAAWSALSGRHDDRDGGGTVLAFAGTSSASVPLRWFARNDPYPGLAPSPSFDAEITLPPGGDLHLAHRFVFIDRWCDLDELESLAATLEPGRPPA